MDKETLVAKMLQGLKEEGLELAEAFEINWELVDSTTDENIAVRRGLVKALAELDEVEAEYVYSLLNPKTHKIHMGKNQYAGYIMDLADKLVDGYAAQEVYGKIRQVVEVTGGRLGSEWDWEAGSGQWAHREDWEEDLGS